MANDRRASLVWHRTEDRLAAVLEAVPAIQPGPQFWLDSDAGPSYCRACDICGKTLSYILTDDGVQQEVNYYRDAPLCALRDEDSYALDRLTLNIWEGAKRDLILGAAVAVNQAWRLLPDIALATKDAPK